jgi:hypothetical protein
MTEVLANPTQNFLSLQTVKLAFLAKDLGRAAELQAFLEASPRSTLWHAAARVLLEGDDARAGDLLEELGIPALSAHARLRAAKALSTSGRRAEADEQLQAALAFSGRWVRVATCATRRRYWLPRAERYVALPSAGVPPAASGAPFR